MLEPFAPDAFNGTNVIFPSSEGQATLKMPIASFLLKKKTVPIDSQNLQLGELVDLPPEDDWIRVMRDIAVQNYDEREALRVRPLDIGMEGNSVTKASVVPVKGWTRVSAILYILKHGGEAIARLGDESQEERNSFRECSGKHCLIIWGGVGHG